MLMILTAFTPWFFASGRAEGQHAGATAPLKTEGSLFPSYPVFRDALSLQLLQARQRVCIVSSAFEDRELALMMYGVSRRSVSTAIRVNPRTRGPIGRIERVADELSALGLPVLELSIHGLKLSEPTLLAVDGHAWTVSVPLSQFKMTEVETAAAPWTAAEVCSWAEAARSAKPATAR
jgi:hypothetical protein